MKLKNLILSGLVTMAAPLIGQQYCCDYNNNCCDTGSDYCANVFVDWLYWNVRDCNLDFAATGDDATILEASGRLVSVDTEYESGFRVGAFTPFCSYEIGFVYTRFHNDHNCDDVTRISQADGNLNSTALPEQVGLNAINEAESDYEVEFDQLDIAFVRHHQPQWLCNTNVTVGGGLRFAWIDRERNIEYRSTNDNAKVFQKTENDLYGVFVGLATDTQFCECFSFLGEFSIAAFVAENERKTRVTSTLTSPVTDFFLEDDCGHCAVANINLALGLAFDFNCLCDACARLAVGYEFHNWLNLPNFISPQEAVNNAWQLDRYYGSLGFDGLFLRLAVSF